MNADNIGRFTLELDFVKKHPNLVACFLGKINFVPVRAEIIDWGHFIDYIGLSPKFRKKEDGEGVPLYQIDISVDTEGAFTFNDIGEVKNSETPIVGG